MYWNSFVCNTFSIFKINNYTQKKEQSLGLLEIKILCMPEAICQHGDWCFNKLALHNSNSMCWSSTKQTLYQEVNCSRQDIYDLPQNKTYHRILNIGNTTCATSRTGIPYPSWTFEFTPGLSGTRGVHCLVFYLANFVPFISFCTRNFIDLSSISCFWLFLCYMYLQTFFLVYRYMKILNCQYILRRIMFVKLKIQFIKRQWNLNFVCYYLWRIIVMSSCQ